MTWAGDWHHKKFDPDQSLFTSSHVLGVEGQETVNHYYRRNIKEHNVGDVELGEKIQNILIHDVSWYSLKFLFISLRGSE